MAVSAKSLNTPILNLWAYSRFFNIIGNVLGRAGYYNAYEAASNKAIYIFGYPDEGAHVATLPQVAVAAHLAGHALAVYDDDGEEVVLDDDETSTLWSLTLDRRRPGSMVQSVDRLAGGPVGRWFG